VIRVLTRYYGIGEDVQKSPTLKKIWAIAEEILPDEEPWLVVEGLIELGAMVCKREAQCWACPLISGCAAYREGTQSELPKKGKKIEVTPLFREVFVISHGESFLVRKGVEGKVMADLYEFPYIEKGADGSFPFSFAAKKVGKLEEVRHSFTRFRVRLFPTRWQAEQKIDLEGYAWVPRDEIDRYPFSSGHKKILLQVL
jgi:A/G-specific adenine glycosylase